MFEMLTGRDPFARNTVAQVLWAQMNDPLPSISAVQPARVSAALDAVLAKACARLPADCYFSAEQFLRALSALGALDLGAAVPVVRRRSSSQAPADVQTNAQGQRRTISLPVPVGAGESRITMLSIALTQLQTLRLTADKYLESTRHFTLRQMLATSIEQESVVIATNPSLRGQTKTAGELVKLFQTTPLAGNYSLTQRNAMLAKLETNVIGNLQQDHPGDGDFWRRMYVGLLLLCEETPAARQALGVELPGSAQCLNMVP